MTGITLAVATSIAVGMSIGAAATVGGTLAVEALDSHGAAETNPPAPTPSGPHLVDYGDRCIHGHCLPCDSVQGCLNKLPW